MIRVSDYCLTDGPPCWGFAEPAVSTTPTPMTCEYPFFGMCLIVPGEQDGGIFGFSEFVQAFALLVLVYTVSDVRYRFRVETAPIRIWQLTFWISGVIGIGTLLTDLWFAQRYPTPWFLASR